jgi:hypothetical protein
MIKRTFLAKKRVVNVLFLLLLFDGIACGQTPSSFAGKPQIGVNTAAPQGLAGAPQSSVSLSGNAAAYEPIKMFIHTDKAVYQPSESIWFTGFVLNRNRMVMEDQHTLYMLLVDAVERKLVLQQRFSIQSGIGKGSIFLPDSLAAGDYWLIAYTNTFLNYRSQSIFRKWISVRTEMVSPFRVVRETRVRSSPDSMRLTLQIGTSYSGLAAGGSLGYTVFADNDSVAAGNKMIDAFGEVVIDLALGRLAGKKAELVATVKRNGLSRGFILPLDTSAAAPHLAERQAAVETQRQTVLIEPDSSTYHTRSKVSLHFRLRDSLGNPLRGMYSVSVAYSKRVNGPQTGNIADFSMEPGPSVNAAADILAKAYPTQSQYVNRQDISDFGYVLFDGKKPKKPVALALMGTSYVPFETDSSGWFALPPTILVAAPGAVNYLSVVDKSSERYKIFIYDKADTVNKQLAAIHYPLNFVQTPVGHDPEEQKIETSEQMLKAAIVKAKIPEECNTFVGEYRSMHCDQDYVCYAHYTGHTDMPYPHLNCPYHLGGGSKPQEGMLYLVHVPHGGEALITYHCAAPKLPSFMTPVRPILMDEPFPLQDYGMSNNTNLGSGLQTTIFWKSLLSADKNGEGTITFYANDLTGKFTCTLHGISAKGIISAQSSFMVTP